MRLGLESYIIRAPFCGMKLGREQSLVKERQQCPARDVHRKVQGETPGAGKRGTGSFVWTTSSPFCCNPWVSTLVQPCLLMASPSWAESHQTQLSFLCGLRQEQASMNLGSLVYCVTSDKCLTVSSELSSGVETRWGPALSNQH